MKNKRSHIGRTKQQNPTKSDRQSGADAIRHDANTGAGGRGDRSTGIGASSVSSDLRCRRWRCAAGRTSALGAGSAAPSSTVLPTAEGILRHQTTPGEWGKVLGLDRIPEVRTLRSKIELLCRDPGPAMQWNAELAKEWMARQALFARWSQEDFFRYMREHYGLDEYGTEPIPDAIEVVNPQWRRLDSQIRSKTAQCYRLAAQFGAVALSEDVSEKELQFLSSAKDNCRNRSNIWTWRSSRACAPNASTSSIRSK